MNAARTPVTQADRDAAWAIARFYLGNDSSFPDELRDGRIERHFMLDILAKHRAAPELLEALEATLDGLRRASRQLSDDHKMVLNGKPWGGLLIDNAERAIAKARGEP